MKTEYKAYAWQHVSTVSSKSYVCGHCGESISSNQGYYGSLHGKPPLGIYICHSCNLPTLLTPDGKQVPGSAYGMDVNDVGDILINTIYEEARNCCQVNAYTAAVLSCRKLLMHIAVSKGAGENQSFAHYVTYLAEKNYVPPDAKDWVDHIRKTGNEATHEIKLMTKDDAEHLIDFVGMLLKVIYEFPASAKRRTPPKS